jgi:hypothetical protein
MTRYDVARFLLIGVTLLVHSCTFSGDPVATGEGASLEAAVVRPEVIQIAATDGRPFMLKGVHVPCGLALDSTLTGPLGRMQMTHSVALSQTPDVRTEIVVYTSLTPRFWSIILENEEAIANPLAENHLSVK